MKKRAIKIIIALILFALALAISFPQLWMNKFLFLLSYIFVGLDILRKAWRNLLRGKMLDENFLMSVATLGAFAVGEFSEAVAVMLFYQIGELFQSYAVDKSRKSIANLMDIRPDYANILREEMEEKVNPNEVKIGEMIIIKPGEKVPLDGIIIEGNSCLDTKALTGESVPREVSEGEEVLSGCINVNSLLKIKVTKEFGESTVSKILNLVENASSRKSKSENFITKFARVYTPIVVIIAVILAFFPPLLIPNASFADWVYRALSFLVVSCPCALVISIPLSFFAGIGAASKMGILVKGSNYLEALSQAEIMVFDKTGTLSKGIFEVQEINAIGISKEELLKIVAHAESYSNHPIAQSIQKAYDKKIDTNLIVKTEELSGYGIISQIENQEVLVGNEKMMRENQIDFVLCDSIGTILYVAIDRKYVGYILIADEIKADAQNAIKKLKQNHIKKIVMLTGDKKQVGESVAAKLGLDAVYTELLPDGKVRKVEEFMSQKSKKGKLIFAGDGINDAPVLALADIGIAMGGLGADSAIEAADVVIMTDEPSGIASAIKLARKNLRIVKENIGFAISIKVLVLLLSALGISTMWEAVFADVGVAVIAILNALRMLKVKSIN